MPHTPHPRTTIQPDTDAGSRPLGTAPPPANSDRHGEQPAVPLAVWSTPAPPRPAGHAWVVPPLLAQRLLAVYTHPAATVLASGDSARLIARTAARLDRRPPARGPGRRLLPATVDLLVATPPASASAARAAEQARRWAELLTPTGVLAVVLAPTRRPDEPAAVVAAAAGLTYLQHVVALTWPLHDDHLHPPIRHPAGAAPGHPGTARSNATEPQRADTNQIGDGLAFADVLVFTATSTGDRPEAAAAQDGADPPTEPAGPTPARERDNTDPALAAGSTPCGRPANPVPGSVWPVAQTSPRAQRLGRYTPASVAHPAKMLPALARTAITTYTAPGELVLDPMCGIGTTLVEAVHTGRDAAGVEYEPRWARLARENIGLAVDAGAAGHAAVAVGDARHAPALLGGDLTGRVRLLLTSPPYGSSTHGRVDAPGSSKVRKWYHRYGHDRANLAHRPLADLLEGFAEVLRACLPLLGPDATVVITARPYRQHGRLVDLPGAALHMAAGVGLEPVGRYVALLAGIRGGQLVPRASFFQLANTRAARAAGLPLQVPAHEDVLVLRALGRRQPSPERDPVAGRDHTQAWVGSGSGRRPR